MASFSSSPGITCINSTLDNMDFPVSAHIFKSYSMFPEQRYRLRILKTFVLLAGKFGNDVRLGSLLTRIEDAVTRISPVIIPNSLWSEDLVEEDEVYFRAVRIARDFQRDFLSLKEGVDEWYINTSDNTQQSNSQTADEVGEIFESILESLEDLPFFSQVLVEAMEPVREHMSFLKNFCRFAARRVVDHGQVKDFLAHSHAVALCAAHLFFLCEADMDVVEEIQPGIQFKISTLLQKVKLTNFQVCKTYTEALSCTKFSRRLDTPTRIQEMEDDSIIVMKNFVDSLVSILWEMIRLDTCHVASLKDHWQQLYEGLRSLRIILKKLQPKDIDEKNRDDIGVMVCDAGVLVCSFYHRNVEIDLGLQDLLERINFFLAEAKVELPHTSTFNPSSINVRGFVDFLLENLIELANGTVEPIVRSRVQSIEEELLYLKSLEIVALCYELEELRAFRNRVLEVAYQVEFLMDHLIVGAISDSFSMQFDSVMEDIRNIKSVASKSSYGKRENIKVKDVTSTFIHVLPSEKMASITTEGVGFQDETVSIMDGLQRGSKQLRVIAIVGMGGLGKTTLAAKVYNHPAMVHYFHVRAWCPVSQTFNKRWLLLDLLNQIQPEKCSEMTEQDLVQKLWRHLKGRRYLIFLDDIWTIEAWNSLQASFPDDSTGSRIILTSRNYDAVPFTMLDEGPLLLRQLSKEESLELLQRKLFSGEVWPRALYDIGMQIVETCKGLPLTIVLLAGVLATTEQGGWKEIVDGFSAGMASITEQCMNTLELSYKHLPDYLKSCFLYFGVFPEDREVSVGRLIRLWIAEGFVQKSKLKSLEDVAEDYMKDLIGRSLIMVAKRGSMGGVKRCRIHDLLHGFCVRKAKDEHFLHLVKGNDELLAFNEPCNIRRLCIHSESEHLKESKLFCPRARSLLFFPFDKGDVFMEDALKDIFLVHIFKCVSVLDLEGTDLGVVFPSEIELLVQLRFLAIECSMSAIPSWIGNLSMLETFIVFPSVDGVSLPDSIWNLRKLKYLCIRTFHYVSGGGELPIENLDSNYVLYVLDTFSGAVFICGDSMEKQMRKFPNIRELKCILHRPWYGSEAVYRIGVPDFLTRLESLHLTSMVGLPADNIQFEFCFPANLKKLALMGFELPWSKISTIGKLPNLEVLKLLDDSFMGETWEMEEGELFGKLRYLKLSWLKLEMWRASDDDQFPCLEKLVLECCECLEEMPSCLESAPTLEMIEVRNCSEATSSLVKCIEEEQVSLGNTAFKMFVIKSFGDDDFEE